MVGIKGHSLVSLGILSASHQLLCLWIRQPSGKREQGGKMQAVKMDGFSFPKLPQAPRAFKLVLGVEKVRTASTDSPSPVHLLQAQGHRAKATQPSPQEPSRIEQSAFYARPQQAIQTTSVLPTLSFPSGKGTFSATT